jgi:hypothetical protein
MDTFNNLAIDKSIGWRIKQLNFDTAFARNQVYGKAFKLLINLS